MPSWPTRRSIIDFCQETGHNVHGTTLSFCVLAEWNGRESCPSFEVHLNVAAAVDVLTEETVQLSATATDKVDAIKQSGQLLVTAGYVAPSYVDGMLAREQIASNYLGNGIALPHGRLEDLKNVYHTGLSVLQLPQGVEWDSGERVHVVIGLAAVSDEHMAVLTNLVELLQNIEDIQRLVLTDDPAVIINRLTRD